MSNINKSILVYGDTGQPQYTTDWPWPESIFEMLDAQGQKYTIVDRDIPISNYWVLNGVATVRENEASLSAERLTLLSDGLDGVTIRGLADVSYIKVNDALFTVDGDVFNLSTNTSGVYEIEAVGNFYSNIIEIKAEPLKYFQECKWSEVKDIRQSKVDGGVNVAGLGIFDSDSESRSNINGAVTGAVLAKMSNAPFQVSWKIANNSVISMDADQVIAAGEAVLNYVSACHGRSQQLGLEILATTRIEELDAIDIQAGWPM